MKRRPRWRAYLLLARVSNLPTVWTNVLAGTVVSGAAVEWPRLAAVSLAVSLLYTAGMFLNDVCDHRFDAEFRPDRPIPAGDVTRREALVTGVLLMLLGGVALGWCAGQTGAIGWASLLAASIVYYDYRHKRDRFGPLAMGVCRGLVYCVAAAASAQVTGLVLCAAAIMAAYVTGLTVVAKRLGRRAHSVVPYLIAGISLVDAAVVATAAPALAPLAALGFVFTLAFQRCVPGD